MFTSALILIPKDPLLELPRAPLGFAALGAVRGGYRKDCYAEKLGARLLNTRFRRVFGQGDSDRKVAVGVGWTEGRNEMLAIEIEGAIAVATIELVAQDLSADREVRVRAATVTGGGDAPIAVSDHLESRWAKRVTLDREESREATARRVQRRFGNSRGVSDEAVAQWLVDSASLFIVDTLNFHPLFSPRVQPLVERIMAGATTSWVEVVGREALRVQFESGAEIAVLSEAEREEISEWL